MVTRGYASISYLQGAGEVIERRGKPAYLYYFGDYDPSGVDITRAVEAGVREFAPPADIHFERIAVTLEQVTAMNLPTPPTKRTDSRSKNFDGESVEVMPSTRTPCVVWSGRSFEGTSTMRNLIGWRWWNKLNASHSKTWLRS